MRHKNKTFYVVMRTLLMILVNPFVYSVKCFCATFEKVALE